MWVCTHPHGHLSLFELSLEGFGMHSKVLHIEEDCVLLYINPPYCCSMLISTCIV